MTKNAAAMLLFAFLAPCVTTAANADRIFSDGFDRGAPVVLYTDIVSGPTSGGENNKGAYLSIFGKNFGTGSLGTNIKVFVGSGEVDNYRYAGLSKGRADIEQITVQLGALGGDATPGAHLPVRVTVDGAPSNADQLFMINPGHFIFVDPVNGSDATGQIDNIAKPFQHVQTGSDFTAGAWGKVRAGDFLVLRGGTYSGVGFESYFLRFQIRVSGVPDRSSGTPPTGAAGTGPITLTAYPTETAFINGDSATHAGGALSGLNGQTYPLAGKWIVIANLKVEGGGYDGPISQEIHGDNWRIINNELTAFTGVTSGANPSRMAGITGNGQNSVWLGNHIHDIQGSTNEAHGIYIDGDGSYDIGYNHIHDIHSGKGIQLFANGGNGSDAINNVRIHHNLIRHVTQFGINIADGSTNAIAIFDNVVTEAQVAGLRFNTHTLHGCRIYNNTFFNNNTLDSEIYGVLMNDWTLPSDALDMRNNIFWARSTTAYSAGSVGFDDSIGVITRNLWFGGNDSFAFDANPLNANPQLVDPIDGNFHVANASSPVVDAGSATVASLVTNDFDADRARPPGAGIDVGAYEFSR
ncbi:MAG: choice-of-anchor Q domain-containing protein [Dokdonella sp.]